MKEADQAYIVQAEVPGVKKEDDHVTIDGNPVSLTSEVKRETEDKDGVLELRLPKKCSHLSQAAGNPRNVHKAAQAAFSFSVQNFA